MTERNASCRKLKRPWKTNHARTAISEEGEYKNDEEFIDETVDFSQLMLLDEENQLTSSDITQDD